MNSAKEWRDFYKSPGAIATCNSPLWLAEGCPKCGCKRWQVTSDSWAYCCGCSEGFATAYPFTREDLDMLDFEAEKGGKGNGNI